MNTRMKIMGLAALPLAGLLATGGVALAQTAGPSAGTPAGTSVVKQVVPPRAGEPCPLHAVKTTAQPVQQRLQVRDRDCGTCGDHQQARTADRTMDQHRDGSCDELADR